METQNFIEWMSDKFLHDGFFVKISFTRSNDLIFSLILPDFPNYQASRAIPDDMTHREMLSLYFDIATSIRKLERHAENRQQKMA